MSNKHRSPTLHRKESELPLRIAVASESPLDGVNGVTNSVKQVLKYLHNEGHEAVVICPKPAPDSFAGFEVVKTRSIPFQGFSLGIPGPRKLPKNIERFEPDVVHVASPFWTLGRTAISGSRELGVPSIAVYQTDIVSYSRRYKSEAITTFAKRVTADLHNNATRTLAPSQSARTDLIDYGVDESTIFQWGRGVDLEQYTADRASSEAVHKLRHKLLGDRNVPIVGYVGRLATEKNVDRLRVLGGIDAQLVIVGGGPTRQELEASLPKDTIFLGSLKGKALATAYASFDMFVHTGTQETFGQTLQEAMATGLPVIAPAIGGPLDIVTHGATGLLYAPYDDDSLRMSVVKLLENEEERHEMGRQGRIAVEQKSWSKLGRELVAHYRDVIVK